MSIPYLRLIAITIAVGAIVGGAYALYARVVAKADAQGAARVQSEWTAQETARNEATARDNALKFRNAERTAHEDAQREAARRVRDAAAAAAMRGLRGEIARLNSRPDPYPAGDAGLAACAREARTARELFGQSSSAYQELAADADGLRDQVTGLQAFVRDVCRAPEAAID